jgi:nicotinate phosphoribosyltransferase
LAKLAGLSECGDRPAVKPSDNPDKMFGPADEIERYRRIFGSAGMAALPVLA